MDFVARLRAATDPAQLATLHRTHVRPGVFVTFCLPGLTHRQAHQGPLLAARELTGLLDAVTLLAAGRGQVRLEGELVNWRATRVADTVLEVLTLLASAGDHVPVAAVVSRGLAIVEGDLWLGPPVSTNRLLVPFARRGDLLLTDAARGAWTEIPDGIGVFLAPQPISDAAGTAVHIVRDYRE